MKLRKILAILIVAAITLSLFTAPVHASLRESFSVADALTALQASMGLITLSEEQASRLDIDNDGEVTLTDALMILRLSMNLPAVAPPPVTPPPTQSALSAEVEAALLESYAAFKEYSWWGNAITADDLMIMSYFGTYNGHEVVVIFSKMWMMTADMQFIHLAGYTISLGSGSLELVVHKDGMFTEIRQAYAQGMLTADDIRQIATFRQEPAELEAAPTLSLIYEGQWAQAIQLTTSWTFDGGGFSFDSPHPLQLRQSDYDNASLTIKNGEIMLLFSDNHPPETVTVRRWLAEHAKGEQDISAALLLSETVNITDGYKILVENDGKSYIYDVHATWGQGSSFFAFRTVIN